MNRWRILAGDARAVLATLPAASVQTCVTSPPYWGLRDYGATGQLGLESTPAEYVAGLVAVFDAVARVLRDDGTLWLNLGDSYAGGGVTGSVASFAGLQGTNRESVGMIGTSTIPPGLKPKDLIGIPWRVAFALQAAGWYLRSDVIWSKPNPMPESVTDRPTKAHEYLFLLAKSERYRYDAAAIAEAAEYGRSVWTGDAGFRQVGNASRSPERVRGRVTPGDGGTRNRRSVWTVPTQPYPDAHFATYPEDLITPCILAGSRPGDVVLDPFAGSGTTGAVAIRHQRDFVGVELNPAYIQLARRRIGDVAPLFAREDVA